MRLQDNAIIINCDGFYLISLKGYFSQELSLSLHYRQGQQPLFSLSRVPSVNSIIVASLAFKDKVYLNVTTHNTSCEDIQTASEHCVAKFGPSPSKWKMSSCQSPCVNYTDDWKLRILQDGLYLVYAQVTPNATYQDLAPFEVRLLKNQDIIQVITDKSKIEYVGRSFELHTEDTINLIFNSEHQVLKNNTYLGIFLIDNLKFTS